MRMAVSLLGSLVLTVGLASAAAATADEAAPPQLRRIGSAASPAASPPASGSEKDLPPVTPVGDDVLSHALARGEISTARYALERARTLFAPRRVERTYGQVDNPDPREATLILRDLAVRDHRLARAARADARRILARPTDGFADPQGTGYRTPNTAAWCATHVCVHWANDTSDRPPSADTDGDGVPNQVETTAAEFERVWRVEVTGYGYRPPKSDLTSSNNGGDERLDVYLADIGTQQLYGYCATDDPDLSAWDVSAYCVLDNDFAQTQFHAPPLDSLRVTAAHEFFHAVQFGYDIGEDLWLMEGSAAWIEDEVHDGINDNLQYLRGGPLTAPHRSLDAGVYDSWIFLRFMAEYFGTAATDRPVVVREIWRHADAAAGAPDDYSLQAIARVSAARGVALRSLFADFGWTGPFASRVYAEGRSYPQAPMTANFTLTPTTPSTGTRAVTINHLANRHIALRPGRTLPAQRRLKVTLNLPDRARGSEATVTVQRRDGSLRPYAVALNVSGNGSRTVAFSRAVVARVVVTLTNASSRMRCGTGSGPTCNGQPVDDRLRFSYIARAIR
jgi:hypothetical protein